MVSRRGAPCTCSRSLYLLPSLLFLHSILPSSSYAQVVDPSNSSPSTLQASLSPSPISTRTATPSKRQENNATPTPTNSGNPYGRNQGNYYFIIVAIIIILFILAMLYYGKRRKQKAAIMHSNGQRALAEDVEGLRNRFGMGRGGMRRAHQAGGVAGEQQRNNLRAEGLDERGEAPPPYNPGSKPPSLRSCEGVAVREVEGQGQAVEMSRMSTLRQDPPGYHQELNANGNSGGSTSWSDLDMARPAPAVMAAPRRDGTIH